MKTYYPFRKSVALVLAVVMATLPAHDGLAGNLQSEVDKMLNNLGTIDNITAPGAFRGQTYNTYTGGNLFIRAPNKVYQLATIDFPFAKAGCGGIDAFGGSFSHVSAAEFKNILKNITAALPGVAFQLALSSVSPLLGQKVEWIKSLETFINNARINSCETAQALVRGGANASGLDAFSSCVRVALQLGLESDEDAARRRCNPAQQNNVLNAGRSSGDASARAMAPFVGNLTWEALKRSTAFDPQEAEIIMSMVGTVIVLPDDRTPRTVPPVLTSLNQMLYGNEDAGGGKVRISLLSCQGNVDTCDNPVPVNDVLYEPLTTKVENLMRSLSEKIRTRGTPSPQETAFVNRTSEPVYRMLAVGNTIEGSGLAEILIMQYRDMVAVDYAFGFLERNFREGLEVLSNSFPMNSEQQGLAAELRERVRTYLVQLNAERQRVSARSASFSQVAADLERIERQLRANMPQHVMDLLGQSALMTAQ
ncbi:conjugal transfer protein TraH [Actimicrobium sp. CCI2.3]|uniref:conjugal transfer protein TraH n=1 Tax=Actimicrobium sp. CCI2.3 TaxID=3048616 RepID=UPI002AB39CE2|nr:conjugal transfer protein TraH [Actimicrobium sp. CCI2.3]MDY7574451.1 conjugal transfer protein TraH [Actimicrobium sp. CCI2.3]MEB0022471.1 conjugal transfer protein TraH [Actimicrobium sp. CCI2.3]